MEISKFQEILTTSVRDFKVVRNLSFDNLKEDAAVDMAFAVKTPSITFVHWPSPPRKSQLMENRGTGMPKKKLREEDWECNTANRVYAIFCFY